MITITTLNRGTFINEIKVQDELAAAIVKRGRLVKVISENKVVIRPGYEYAGLVALAKRGFEKDLDMKKEEFYRQCRFQKGSYETVAWIPDWAAVVGNRVQLLSLDGEFWLVTEASRESVSAEFIKDNERNYKEFQHSTKGGGID